MDFKEINIGIGSFIGFLVFLVTSGLLAYAFRGYFLKNFASDFANKTDFTKLEAKMDAFMSSAVQKTELDFVKNKIHDIEVTVKENKDRYVLILEKIEEQLSILSLTSATSAGSLRHIEKRLDEIEKRQWEWDGVERRKNNQNNSHSNG